MDLVSSKRETSYDEFTQVPSPSNELQSTELVQYIDDVTIYSNLYVMRMCVCVCVCVWVCVGGWVGRWVCGFLQSEFKSPSMSWSTN